MSSTVASTTKRMTELFELLPEEEQGLVLNLVVHLLPDDVATEDDLIAIAEARAEYARGEYVDLEDFMKEMAAREA